MIKRILVGLGGRLTEPAIDTAIEISKIHKAELAGVTVLDIGRLENVGPVPPGAYAYAKKMIERRINGTQREIYCDIKIFEQKCQKAKVAYALHEEKGDPFSKMISLSRYYDLVVCGLKSIFDYGFVKEPKNTLSRLVREGVRPILAVSGKPHAVKRVLVAYSGSMHSAKAMKHYIQLRLWPLAKIKILCIDKKKQDAADFLNDAAAYCLAHGFKAETEHVVSEGKNRLLDCAAKFHADLIVMGNSMRNLLARQVMGDIALHTIRHSKRALFLSQ